MSAWAPIVESCNLGIAAAMPTYKGDDGLSEAERIAYAVCNPVSCKHAACQRNNLYMSEEFKKQKCGPLFDEWKKCFDAEGLRPCTVSCLPRRMRGGIPPKLIALGEEQRSISSTRRTS